jgi:hypothetical protein
MERNRVNPQCSARIERHPYLPPVKLYEEKFPITVLGFTASLAISLQIAVTNSGALSWLVSRLN